MSDEDLNPKQPKKHKLFDKNGNLTMKNKQILMKTELKRSLQVFNPDIVRERLQEVS